MTYLSAIPRTPSPETPYFKQQDMDLTMVDTSFPTGKASSVKGNNPLMPSTFPTRSRSYKHPTPSQHSFGLVRALSCQIPTSPTGSNGRKVMPMLENPIESGIKSVDMTGEIKRGRLTLVTRGIQKVRGTNQSDIPLLTTTDQHSSLSPTTTNPLSRPQRRNRPKLPPLSLPGKNRFLGRSGSVPVGGTTTLHSIQQQPANTTTSTGEWTLPSPTEDSGCSCTDTSSEEPEECKVHPRVWPLTGMKHVEHAPKMNILQPPLRVQTHGLAQPVPRKHKKPNLKLNLGWKSHLTPTHTNHNLPVQQAAQPSPPQPQPAVLPTMQQPSQKSPTPPKPALSFPKKRGLKLAIPGSTVKASNALGLRLNIPVPASPETSSAETGSSSGATTTTSSPHHANQAAAATTPVGAADTSTERFYTAIDQTPVPQSLENSELVPILPGLYLGSEYAAANEEVLRKAGVRWVINVAKEIENPWPGMVEMDETRGLRIREYKRSESDSQPQNMMQSMDLDHSAVNASSKRTSVQPPSPEMEDMEVSSMTESFLSAVESHGEVWTTPVGLHPQSFMPGSGQPASTPMHSTQPHLQMDFRTSQVQEPPSPPPAQVQHYMKFEWGHNQEDVLAYLPTAFAFIDAGRRANVQEKAQSRPSSLHGMPQPHERSAVLVHCQAGLSRSAALVIAYVMRELRTGFDTAYNYVKSKSGRVSPNMVLVMQLCEAAERMELERRNGGGKLVEGWDVIHGIKSGGGITPTENSTTGNDLGDGGLRIKEMITPEGVITPCATPPLGADEVMEWMTDA